MGDLDDQAGGVDVALVDLTTVETDGDKLRCPRCQRWVAALCIVQAGAMCRECARKGDKKATFGPGEKVQKECN